MYVVPVTITFLALSIVIVAVRLYTRLYLVHTAGWDDLVISVALVRGYLFLTWTLYGTNGE
jgi:hypothetical protein